jgi:hypothetical protein
MLENTYTYLGYTILQYNFNGRRFFYPGFGGDAEFTSIRRMCKWLKGVRWAQNIVNKHLTI